MHVFEVIIMKNDESIDDAFHNSIQLVLLKWSISSQSFIIDRFQITWKILKIKQQFKTFTTYLFLLFTLYFPQSYQVSSQLFVTQWFSLF